MNGKNKEAIEQALTPVETTGQMIGYCQTLHPYGEDRGVSASEINKQVAEHLQSLGLSPTEAKMRTKVTFLKAVVKGTLKKPL